VETKTPGERAGISGLLTGKKLVNHAKRKDRSVSMLVCLLASAETNAS
jgi:hypothetical protein